jgi:hypothetical protein
MFPPENDEPRVMAPERWLVEALDDLEGASRRGGLRAGAIIVARMILTGLESGAIPPPKVSATIQGYYAIRWATHDGRWLNVWVVGFVHLGKRRGKDVYAKEFRYRRGGSPSTGRNPEIEYAVRKCHVDTFRRLVEELFPFINSRGIDHE